MGSSSSIPSSNAKIYKRLPCGCIYACSNDSSIFECDEETKDENEQNNSIPKKIELLCCCYECLEKIKTNKYDTNIVKKLYRETRDVSLFDLIEDTPGRWMSQPRAIEYSHDIGLKGFDECIYNKDILKRYGYTKFM